MTEPGWLRWIGTRNVQSLEDAERYLRDGPLASYAQHGHGLYLIVLSATDEPVGVCGLLKREALHFPDLGYAIAESYSGHGYATEAAQATLEHALRDLGMTQVLAICDLDHAASHRVLVKVGMRRNGEVVSEDGSPLARFEINWKTSAQS